jgi:hypothetical protein
MKEQYFVISIDEDGDFYFTAYDTLEEMIHEQGIDEPVEDYNEGCHPAEKFTTKIDDNEAGSVLIKGRILLPQVKEVVRKWDFE